MENRKKLRRLRTILLTTGLPVTFLQWGSIFLWMAKGNYLPFIISIPLLIAYVIGISIFYFNRVAYLCPYCGKVFVSDFKQAFFAKHTPSLRKLKCPCCANKSYCVETYREEET